MVHAKAAEQLLAPRALTRDELRIGLPHVRIGRVELDDLAGLEILDEREPDVGQLFFAWIDDLHGDDVVPRGGEPQRPAPRKQAVSTPARGLLYVAA